MHQILQVFTKRFDFTKAFGFFGAMRQGAITLPVYLNFKRLLPKDSLTNTLFLNIDMILTSAAKESICQKLQSSQAYSISTCHTLFVSSKQGAMED